jgi:hypothetical protein
VWIDCRRLAVDCWLLIAVHKRIHSSVHVTHRCTSLSEWVASECRASRSSCRRYSSRVVCIVVVAAAILGLARPFVFASECREREPTHGSGSGGCFDILIIGLQQHHVLARTNDFFPLLILT